MYREIQKSWGFYGALHFTGVYFANNLLVYLENNLFSQHHRLVHFVTLAKLFPIFVALTIFGQGRWLTQLVLPNVCGSEKRVHP